MNRPRRTAPAVPSRLVQFDHCCQTDAQSAIFPCTLPEISRQCSIFTRPRLQPCGLGPDLSGSARPPPARRPGVPRWSSSPACPSAARGPAATRRQAALARAGGRVDAQQVDAAQQERDDVVWNRFPRRYRPKRSFPNSTARSARCRGWLRRRCRSRPTSARGRAAPWAGSPPPCGQRWWWRRDPSGSHGYRVRPVTAATR